MKTKLYPLVFVCLIASSTGAFAISRTEQIINAHLTPPATSIRTASPGDVDNAIKATINDGSVPANISTYSIVATGLPFAPQFAPDIAATALSDLSTDATLSPRSRQGQTAAIVKVAMNAVLNGSRVRFQGGVDDKSDGASALTSQAVNAVKNSAFTDLLGIVVTTAVKTAQTRGTGVHSGAGGAVTGAISQVAGVNNDNVNDQKAIAGSDDAVVLAVITTATKAAPRRVSDIANAVGYAFAATYRASHIGPETDPNTFLATNKDSLAAAVKAAFRRVSPGLSDLINDQIAAGISLAYTGFEGPGQQGVNDFAYNNGNGAPVTDVSGS